MGSGPLLGTTYDREKGFCGVRSLDLKVEQDRSGYYTQNDAERISNYTLQNVPRMESCKNPRCRQGGIDLQKFVLFQPECQERVILCDGHEGSPQGRRQGQPCDNIFVITMNVERDDTL